MLFDMDGTLVDSVSCVTSAYQAKPKPAPNGILHACDLLNVLATDVAYVGDSPLDLEAARRSGALAVGAAWGHLHDATAPADVVADDPAELLDLVASTSPAPCHTENVDDVGEPGG